jgi:15-cis-phytoene synthase
MPALNSLDASYQARAIPPGTARYWSWLFAAAQASAPLLGIYALAAEWQALTDPATEVSVARLKLAWWQEEMQRLAKGSAVHPISRYLAALPRAASVDWRPLFDAVTAATLQISGAPLERDADLRPHAYALLGGPLVVASELAAESDVSGLRHCCEALAAADYLSRAIRDYRREARAGRVPFAVAELLAAGIGNDDLAVELPPAPLLRYLEDLRDRAAGYFATAARALPQAERRRHRHLLVLAALELDALNGGPRRPPVRRRFKDMLLAWNSARRA